MGLISSVELWVGHFLRTKSHAGGNLYVQTYKIKRKPRILRLGGTN